MPRAVRTSKTDRRDAVFRALSDANRRRILVALGGRELRVKDIAARFGVSRPAISKHLRRLREAGLVAVRPQGRERLYSIVPGALRDAAGYVHDLEAFWAEKMEALATKLPSQ